VNKKLKETAMVRQGFEFGNLKPPGRGKAKNAALK
jgi:hypothetical protein